MTKTITIGALKVTRSAEPYQGRLGAKLVYDFTVFHRPDGSILWRGRGFVTEESRDDAVKIALRVLA